LLTERDKDCESDERKKNERSKIDKNGWKLHFERFLQVIIAVLSPALFKLIINWIYRTKMKMLTARENKTITTKIPSIRKLMIYESSDQFG
jgi:hypothetical protein